MQKAKSFTEVTLLEAVTRRVRADLIVEPVTPNSEARLISQILGINDNGVILRVPKTKTGEKVFLPVGWSLGMSFEMGHLWLQARSEVLDHCLYAPQPGQKIDAIAVRRPSQILSSDRRRSPRHRIDPARTVMATVWPITETEDTPVGSICIGRLLNWSEGGLCASFKQRPPLPTGTQVCVRLQLPQAGQQCPILQGAVRRHCRSDDGSWVLGFGDVTEMGPGEATAFLWASTVNGKEKSQSGIKNS